jgi:hypothetical protein
VLVADGVDWESRALTEADISDLGSYLTAESDPVYLASDATAVTAAKIGNWDAAYAWGDHSVEGYLTSVACSNITDSTAAGCTLLSAADAAAQRTALNVEDGADVTDTANVTAAGALMDSEVDADIKTLDIAASALIRGSNTGDQTIPDVMPQAEAETGTATTQRTITAAVLKAGVLEHGGIDRISRVGITADVSVPDRTGTFVNVNDKTGDYFDPDGQFSGGRFVCNEAGTYQFFASATTQLDALAVSGVVFLGLWFNDSVVTPQSGTIIGRPSSYTEVSTSRFPLSNVVTPPILMEVGDTVQLNGFVANSTPQTSTVLKLGGFVQAWRIAK